MKRTTTLRTMRANAIALALTTITACSGADPTSSGAVQPRAQAAVAAPVSADPKAVTPQADSDEDAIPSGSPEQPEVQALGAAATENESLRATIRKVSFSGNLCDPSARHDSDLSSPGVGYVAFASSLVTNEEATPVAARCSVAFELEVPAGRQLRAPVVQWQVASSSPVTLRFSYQGGASAAPERVSVDGSNTSSAMRAQPEVWSPTCGASRRATFVASLELDLEQYGLASLDDLTLRTDMEADAEWGTCSGSVVNLPVGQVGGSCDNGKRRCAEGLVCQLDSRQQGSCQDPHASFPASAKGQVCGGVQERTCRPGLECWWPSEAVADSGATGSCVGRVAGMEEYCQMGVPALPCAEGLFCDLHHHRCRSGDGSFNSYCGEGFPPCRAGLECQLRKGTTLAGSCLGASSCDEQNPCAAPYICWEKTSSCQLLMKRGDFCGNDDRPCQDGLWCDPASKTCV